MTSCTHNQTEFLWRRDGIDYIRCMDCDQVFESDDLEAAVAIDEEQEEQEEPVAARKRR